MTISEYQAFNTKTNLELSLALKKSITKTKITKKSINNLAIKQIFFNNQQDANRIENVPFGSYYKLNWKWESDEIARRNDEMESTPPVFSDDSKSVCLHPYCTSCFETNAVRGNRPLKVNGYTYWEITIVNKVCSGTSLMIGIGNKKAQLNSIGYLNLIGNDENSWGVSHRGYKWNKNEGSVYCDPFEQNGPIKIGCLFDGFKGHLTFYKNGKSLGVAFDRIPLNNELFPMVSSTVAESVFRLDFACEDLPTLKELCKEHIEVYKNRESFLNQMKQTRLPKTLVDYLKI